MTNKLKQPELEKSTRLPKPAAEKKGLAECPVTWGAEVNPLTREELVDLPDQDIMGVEEGKSYSDPKNCSNVWHIVICMVIAQEIK